MSEKKRGPEGFWKIPDPTPTPGETTNQNPQSTEAAVLSDFQAPPPGPLTNKAK